MYFWRQLTCVLIVENWRCWCSVVSFLRLVIFKGKFHLIITRGWRFSWFLCYPLNSVNVYGVYKQKGLCLRTGTGLVFLPYFSPPQDLQSVSLVLQVLKLWSFLFEFFVLELIIWPLLRVPEERSQSGKKKSDSESYDILLGVLLT